MILPFDSIRVTALLPVSQRTRRPYLSSVVPLAPPNASIVPPLDTMDQIAKTTLIFGFHCMTGGLLIGSLIAQEHMGAAYFLDPKVVLSFVMWVLYLVILFVRRSTGLRGKRAVYLSSAVFLLMLCVLAANLFSSVHRFPTQ